MSGCGTVPRLDAQSAQSHAGSMLYGGTMAARTIACGVALAVLACGSGRETPGSGVGGDRTAATRDQPPAPAPDLPLTLGDFALTAVPGALPGRSALQLEMTARLNRPLDATMVVHAKPVCRHGARLVTDVQPIEIVEVKHMDDYAVGERPQLRGELFADVWSDAVVHCQIQLDLTSRVREEALPLATLCWQDGKVAAGACAPPLLPAAAPAAGSPITVEDVTLAAAPEHTLVVTVLAAVHTDTADPELFVKSTCPVDGVALVDTRRLRSRPSPFRYQAGESLLRATRLYWPKGFGVTGPLDGCEILVGRWPDGDLGAPVELARACWKDGAAAKGACGPVAQAPAARPIGPGLVKVSNVLVEPRALDGRSGFSLDLRVDLTVAEPVTWDSNLEEVKLRCAAAAGMHEDQIYLGTASRSDERTFDGVGLHSLVPGETSRVGGFAFQSPPLPAAPDTCEIVLDAAVIRGEPFELARFCVTNAAAKPGPCPAGKPAR